jgi:hypothetical protein
MTIRNVPTDAELQSRLDILREIKQLEDSLQFGPDELDNHIKALVEIPRLEQQVDAVWTDESVLDDHIKQLERVVELENETEGAA